MRIDGIMEFYNFVKDKELLPLIPDLGHLIVCVDEYKRLCNCIPSDTRNEKLKSCKNIYVNFIKRSNDFKSALFSKIDGQTLVISSDNQPIITLTR